ncbi:MAG: hypothetical protein HKP31_04685 [Nitrosopumilus sp.]|nr:hypothetical protein [Nitrosopumilus sp.]
MSYSIFGQVVGVRKYVSGDIEIDFYHDDEITEYRSSTDPGKLSNFPMILAESLASTLATDICIEIYFGEDANPTHIELEECDDEDDDEDDDEN